MLNGVVMLCERCRAALVGSDCRATAERERERRGEGAEEGGSEGGRERGDRGRRVRQGERERDIDSSPIHIYLYICINLFYQSIPSVIVMANTT